MNLSSFLKLSILESTELLSQARQQLSIRLLLYLADDLGLFVDSVHLKTNFEACFVYFALRSQSIDFADILAFFAPFE